MNNNIMIMLPEEERLHLMNEEQSKRNVIIASEMLLAYKIKNKYKDKIVIAIPNVISNDEIKKLETLKGIDNVFIVMDNHSILHTAHMIINSLNNIFV